ncbi:MAG: ATP-grasp domain-containing protein [Methanosarcinaceae archaeon]|nr:ATP-grasp domain-containing protein [Methanosarcinaceae archaeon]
MENIVVIGYSSRNIACSAKRAGYNVYAIDAFCDVDLHQCTKDTRTLCPADGKDIHSFDSTSIIEMVNEFDMSPDAVVLGSGFELLDLSELACPVLNNPASIMEQVSDKYTLSKELKTLKVPHPETYSLNDAGSIDRPLMLKPRCAGGGRFNRIVSTDEQIDNAIDEISTIDPMLEAQDMLLQELVKGIPASVSVIANGKQAQAIAVNEQLIGVPGLTNLPFAYCGNITSFENPYALHMCRIATDVCAQLGLIGSNGVDFMVTDEGPVVIEINARFQGSLDSVEMATGMNLFTSHLEAFDGVIPHKPVANQYASRAILYSNSSVVITEDIQNQIKGEDTADIPDIGYVAEQNDPLTSILATGISRNEVCEKMRRTVERINAVL